MCSGNLMLCMLIIADNTVLYKYLKVAKRVDRKCSHHRNEMVAT